MRACVRVCVCVRLSIGEATLAACIAPGQLRGGLCERLISGLNPGSDLIRSTRLPVGDTPQRGGGCTRLPVGDIPQRGGGRGGCTLLPVGDTLEGGGSHPLRGGRKEDG